MEKGRKVEEGDHASLMAIDVVETQKVLSDDGATEVSTTRRGSSDTILVPAFTSRENYHHAR